MNLNPFQELMLQVSIPYIIFAIIHRAAIKKFNRSRDELKD